MKIFIKIVLSFNFYKNIARFFIFFTKMFACVVSVFKLKKFLLKLNLFSIKFLDFMKIIFKIYFTILNLKKKRCRWKFLWKIGMLFNFHKKISLFFYIFSKIYACVVSVFKFKKFWLKFLDFIKIIF